MLSVAEPGCSKLLWGLSLSRHTAGISTIWSQSSNITLVLLAWVLASSYPSLSKASFDRPLNHSPFRSSYQDGRLFSEMDLTSELHANVSLLCLIRRPSRTYSRISYTCGMDILQDSPLASVCVCVCVCVTHLVWIHKKCHLLPGLIGRNVGETGSFFLEDNANENTSSSFCQPSLAVDRASGIGWTELARTLTVMIYRTPWTAWLVGYQSPSQAPGLVMLYVHDHTICACLIYNIFRGKKEISGGTVWGMEFCTSKVKQTREQEARKEAGNERIRRMMKNRRIEEFWKREQRLRRRVSE